MPSTLGLCFTVIVSEVLIVSLVWPFLMNKPHTSFKKVVQHNTDSEMCSESLPFSKLSHRLAIA